MLWRPKEVTSCLRLENENHDTKVPFLECYSFRVELALCSREFGSRELHRRGGATLSRVFSSLPHLTVGLLVGRGVRGGVSDASGLQPLLTGVCHPHFTVRRVTDILLHTRGAGGVHIRESSLLWPCLWPRGISLNCRHKTGNQHWAREVGTERLTAEWSAPGKVPKLGISHSWYDSIERFVSLICRPGWRIFSTVVSHLFTLMFNSEDKYAFFEGFLRAKFWGQKEVCALRT